MADDSTGGEESKEAPPKRKPPPPRVRIRASQKGAEVVEPPADGQAGEPAPERKAAAPETQGPAAPKTEPPLERGSVAVGTDESKAQGGEAKEPAKKPPPPHIARGPRTKPPAKRATEPGGAAAQEPARPAAPVKVSARPARSRPARTKAAKEVPPEPEAKPAAAAEEGEAAASPPARPDITTDEGRLSALSAAMWLLLLVLAVEVYAGFVSNSLALFSDASHVFTDFFAYAIAAAAVELSRRKSSPRETFGWHRAEVVAAFLSGLILVVVVVRIYAEAAQHLAHPEPVDLSYMLTVPWLAVGANLYLTRRLSGGQDLNIEGARLHALSDLLSSLGVIAGGVLIAATGNQIFDPLVSFFIGFLILGAAFRLLRESADILLEKSPQKIDVGRVVDRMKEVEGVADVHQVHVWSLCSTVHAMSAHVVAEPKRDGQRLLESVRATLEKHFAVSYTTLQVEFEACGADRHPTAVHTPAEPAHVHT